MNNTDSFSHIEVGFSPPPHRPLGIERYGAALASLVASLALAVAILVVLATVSTSPSHAPLNGPATAGWSTTQRG